MGIEKMNNTQMKEIGQQIKQNHLNINIGKAVVHANSLIQQFNAEEIGKYIIVIEHHSDELVKVHIRQVKFTMLRTELDEMHYETSCVCTIEATPKKVNVKASDISENIKAAI